MPPAPSSAFLTTIDKATFDDPLLAYAELEKTFSYISSKVDRGLDLASAAEPALEKTAGAISNTFNLKSKE